MSIIGEHLTDDSCRGMYNSPKPRSIWSSIEIDAISRDFNYAGYLDYLHRICVRTNSYCSRISEDSYNKLKEIFNVEMEIAFEDDRMYAETVGYHDETRPG